MALQVLLPITWNQSSERGIDAALAFARCYSRSRSGGCHGPRVGIRMDGNKRIKCIAERYNFFGGGREMRHRLVVAFSVLTVFVGLSAGLAKADSVDASTVATIQSYDFTFVPTSGATYTWSVVNPVPATSQIPNDSFILDNVSYMVGTTADTGLLKFFSANNGGGFILADDASATSYILDEFGP